MHVPFEQEGKGNPQAWPQAPQLLLSVVRLTSQPSAAAPLQLPKPALHAPTKHAPPLQNGDAFAGADDEINILQGNDGALIVLAIDVFQTNQGIRSRQLRSVVGRDHRVTLTISIFS